MPVRFGVGFATNPRQENVLSRSIQYVRMSYNLPEPEPTSPSSQPNSTNILNFVADLPADTGIFQDGG